MISDPIANFLTMVRNAVRARHRYVDVKKSRTIRAMLDLLLKRGFVYKILEKEEKGYAVLRVFLKYTPQRISAIQDLKRVSKPGRRQYTKAKEIPIVCDGFGMAIVSSPAGIIDGKEARAKNVGGEILAYVW